MLGTLVTLVACAGDEEAPPAFTNSPADFPHTDPATEAADAGASSDPRIEPTGPRAEADADAPPTPDVDPSISRIAPDSVARGLVPPTGLDISIYGDHFDKAATVQFGDYLLATSYQSAGEIRIHLGPDRLRDTGDYRLVVTNPSGRTSNPLSFTLASPSPATIARVTPAHAYAYVATAPVTLQVNGAGFLPVSTVRFDGEALATTFLNDAGLTAVLPPELLHVAGPHAVTIGNGTEIVSEPAAFAIDNPLPQIAGTIPAALKLNTGTVMVRVRGSGFVPTATVRSRNGSFVYATHQNTFVSSNELRVPVDTRVLGGVLFTVASPAPGGGYVENYTLVVVR